MEKSLQALGSQTPGLSLKVWQQHGLGGVVLCTFRATALTMLDPYLLGYQGLGVWDAVGTPLSFLLGRVLPSPQETALSFVGVPAPAGPITDCFSIRY